MNSNDLFIRLVQIFQSYSDAAVLWTFLKGHADVSEAAITAGDVSSIELCETVQKKTVQRTIQKFQEMGFINVRVQKNTKTLVTVNRDAVLDLLRQPIAERLPSISKKHFPFIDAWNEDIAKQAAQVAIGNASADEGGRSGAIPDAG
ncbi:MAG: hypothetical protein WBF95_00635 [Comamonas thiooxydans]